MKPVKSDKIIGECFSLEHAPRKRQASVSAYCDVLVVRHRSTLSATTLFWDGLTMRSIRLASPHADTRLRADARGRDGGVREKVAAGVALRSGVPLFGGQIGRVV